MDWSQVGGAVAALSVVIGWIGFLISRNNAHVVAESREETRKLIEARTTQLQPNGGRHVADMPDRLSNVERKVTEIACVVDVLNDRVGYVATLLRQQGDAR